MKTNRAQDRMDELKAMSADEFFNSLSTVNRLKMVNEKKVKKFDEETDAFTHDSEEESLGSIENNDNRESEVIDENEDLDESEDNE